MNVPHTHRDVYLCEGTCRAVVSPAEFASGTTVCGTDGCSHQGKPLTAGVQCDHCGRSRTHAEQSAHVAAHHPAP